MKKRLMIVVRAAIFAGLGMSASGCLVSVGGETGVGNNVSLGTQISHNIETGQTSTRIGGGFVFR